ncbi:MULTISPECIES: DUF4124 domain-containing protein [Halomonadaceae]|uniref:DUF4124 domain-containing protein n=1 Tax=Vreelandella halophila TaxID=86177 RepID=A0A9X4Y9W7_9GAMM|nr:MULTISPECIES: DUF4124 domain-containing protein [Halomonas]MYL25208.1 DUF4124 domain-containing protein [Halomonas utahensis]MYL75270.1 DUF4124 domain-containing protein [Halomonas sp. 22501_18_FS]
MYRWLLTALCLTLTAPVFGEMYRYETDEGRTVMSNTLPREALKQGYEVLNKSGRVIEKVPPPPTEEELAERRRERERQERLEKEREEQKKEDRRLLRQYSSPDDAVRALQRKLRERFGTVRLKLANIKNIEGQIANLQKRAANQERTGQEVPESLREKMETQRAEKTALLNEIQQEISRAEQTREDYRDKIKRLEKLTGKKRSLPLTIPEEETAREELATMGD